MLRKMTLGLLMMLAWQAQAAYQCNVNPQDDIVISPQHVQVIGASGNLQISPQGDIIRNGVPQTLSAEQRRQSKAYQADLRQQLPWIDQGARQHLEKARVALDKVIVQELGSDSNVRNRLTTLNGQLKQQMNRIIEQRSDGLTFHHQAIKQVEQDGKQIVEQSMGGVLQDSLNEMGVKQMSSGGNPLQVMMGNLGGLQKAIQSEWNNQEMAFQSFGNEVCGRVTSLENQRKSLLQTLK
ncbi:MULTISPECIES: DUF2884 domain-containing protein [unclassified Brenneria]|uniref:DUF2884 domain-containing protein n=1 Tax=unclassified Brenneria TaxID=2634434 RepID=UPI0029C3CB3E|nr:MULTISPECIES: DUF2884 domain-containing protein [unclassified Brenneria]MDX5627959.1 DUF2884 domain-containing protein [Brenneria sp. L3-3Z]MDX5695021.1 DUF2884 domain-containing protein [Brenneria sp. L4-2C]MEE3660809.1 DUF2884 domain-containing protein [Brenneria sp. g21c3]